MACWLLFLLLLPPLLLLLLLLLSLLLSQCVRGEPCTSKAIVCNCCCCRSLSVIRNGYRSRVGVRVDVACGTGIQARLLTVCMMCRAPLPVADGAAVAV